MESVTKCWRAESENKEKHYFEQMYFLIFSRRLKNLVDS